VIHTEWSAARAREVAHDVVDRFLPGEERARRREQIANGEADEEPAFREMLGEIGREVFAYKRADVTERDTREFVEEHVRDVQRLAARDAQKEQTR
jgi:hypothetical protein